LSTFCVLVESLLVTEVGTLRFLLTVGVGSYFDVKNALLDTAILVSIVFRWQLLLVFE
jgi:hypothetical protein